MNGRPCETWKIAARNATREGRPAVNLVPRLDALNTAIVQAYHRIHNPYTEKFPGAWDHLYEATDVPVINADYASYAWSVWARMPAHFEAVHRLREGIDRDIRDAAAAAKQERQRGKRR